MQLNLILSLGGCVDEKITLIFCLLAVLLFYVSIKLFFVVWNRSTNATTLVLLLGLLGRTQGQLNLRRVAYRLSQSDSFGQLISKLDLFELLA